MKKSINKAKESESAAAGVGRKVRNDILFIVALLLLIAVVALALFLSRTTGDTVIVTVDGRSFGEYSLNEDREVEIRNGDGYNLLIIQDGKAYVKHASCPDGICSSHRPIEHDGESIICLPNKVVIEVRTRSQKQPDIIT